MTYMEFDRYDSNDFISKIEREDSFSFAVVVGKEDSKRWHTEELEVGTLLLIVHVGPNGNIHRIDGPAIETIDETIIKNFYANEFDPYWIDGDYTDSEEKWKRNKFLWEKWQNRMVSTSVVPQKVFASKETKQIPAFLATDLGVTAKRVAVKKTGQLLQKVVVDFLASNKSGEEKNKAVAQVSALLSTEDGRAAFSILIGAILPLLNQKLPEQYHPILDIFSQEFRVEGLTHFAVEFVDYLMGPGVEKLKELFTSNLEAVAEGDLTKIRVEAPVFQLIQGTKGELIKELDPQAEPEMVDTVSAAKQTKKKST
jgi:hypothetical protein